MTNELIIEYGLDEFLDAYVSSKQVIGIRCPAQMMSLDIQIMQGPVLLNIHVLGVETTQSKRCCAGAVSHA